MVRGKYQARGPGRKPGPLADTSIAGTAQLCKHKLAMGCAFGPHPW